MKCVQPGCVSGSIEAPPSKSMMQRAVLAAALAEGESEILNPSFCDDALAALAVAETLGATVRKTNESVMISGGRGPAGPAILDCGESGLCLRMTSALAATFDVPLELTGRGSLIERPIGMIEAPLRTLGASCESTSGRLPVKITGPIRGGSVNVDGSVSSQFVSGLLMALPRCRRDSTVHVSGLKSAPYVAMTLCVLDAFGVSVRPSSDFSRFDIMGMQKFMPARYSVEGDWSGASFLLVAGAIGGDVEVSNLDLESEQADRAIMEALSLAGARTARGNGSVRVKSTSLISFDFDASECPDLFPPLVALASFASGTSVISGVERLKHKESDRAAALICEFTRLGVSIRQEGNSLLVEGVSVLPGGTVDSHNDHRIAMACAIAALRAEGDVCIQGEECVTKSFPDFFDKLESIRVQS